jgi:hypothetical protein
MANLGFVTSTAWHGYNTPMQHLDLEQFAEMKADHSLMGHYNGAMLH